MAGVQTRLPSRCRLSFLGPLKSAFSPHPPTRKAQLLLVHLYPEILLTSGNLSPLLVPKICVQSRTGKMHKYVSPLQPNRPSSDGVRLRASGGHGCAVEEEWRMRSGTRVAGSPVGAITCDGSKVRSSRAGFSHLEGRNSRTCLPGF